VPPGCSATATAYLAPVELTVTDTNSVPLSNATVTAVSLDCPAGAADATLELGTTDVAGVLRTSLPYGRWQISAAGRTGDGAELTPLATGVTQHELVVN
jgi:hypothetical protein